MLKRLLGFAKRLVKVPLEARVGRLDARYQHREALRRIPTVQQAITAVETRWPEVRADAPSDEPIFILAAGWRSGSTLLQRLVMSSGEALIWGEPYANADYPGSLGRSLRIFTEEYPINEWFIGPDRGRRSDLSEQWIANLYPNVPDLIAAHRRFFLRLYAEPAEARGYRRWGLKEVRLDIEDARYLRLLFPNGKFLFLYRSPYTSWQSYRIWRNWYYRWPNEPIFTAREFGRLWRAMVQGYLDGGEALGGRLVRFEDLVESRTDVEGLARYLSVPLDSAVLIVRVPGRGVDPDPIPATELRMLRRVVNPVASQLGYQG